MAGRSPIVVTISRQVAAGGSYIGQIAARRLGFKYLDREILRRAAERLGAEMDDVEPMEERLAGIWASAARGLLAGGPDSPYVPPPPPGPDTGEVFEEERRLIRDFASNEDVVIVGRGAAHLLLGHPGVFCVFVHAPKAWRVAEAQRTYKLTAAAAETLVTESDRRRAKFVQGLVGRSWTDACLYDLTVDTSMTGMEPAATLVVQTVESWRIRR